MRLYGPDGTTELAVNDNYPGGGLASRINYTLPVDGTYYAVVAGNANSPALGSYFLRLTVTDDHGDNVGAATIIGAHSLSAGSIEIGGDVDAFSFFAESGTQIALATWLTTLGDSTLTLSDSAGNWLAFDDDGGGGLASLITLTVPARGMYVATVAGYSNLQTGTYQLSLEHVDDHADTPALATATTLGTNNSGIIDINGDQDFFRFQAVAGTSYTIATALGTLSDSRLVLYDSNGTTPLITNDDNGINLASRIDFTAPTGGTYFVAVLGKGMSYGSYELSVNLRANADGDFNDDGLYDQLDIDLLVAQIASQGNALAFDMNGDNLVNLVDRDLWLSSGGAINLGPGRAYRLGDANLDGVVDGQDFIIWNSHKFTLMPAWSRGDFNADGVVDGADFIAWNAYQFTSSDLLSQVKRLTSELASARSSISGGLQSIDAAIQDLGIFAIR